MSSDISATLRHLVATRASRRCEYCLLPEALALHKHEPDHIVSRQHGGESEPGNLALACFRCNRHKGPNVGSFDPQTGELVPFYNPRTQVWSEHFQLQDGSIQPLTAEGRVTVKILNLNDQVRILERQRLSALGLYLA